MSFARKILSTRDRALYLVHGFDITGSACWYFVKIPAAKIAAFEARIARAEPLDLSQAGDIILSGYGSEPLDEDRQSALAMMQTTA